MCQDVCIEINEVVENISIEVRDFSVSNIISQDDNNSATIGSDGLLFVSENGGGSSWGEIEGTLSNQIDLQNALNLKANESDLGAVAFSNDYNDLSNKPTIPSIANLVPYTGATRDVILGNYQISSNIGFFTDSRIIDGQESLGYFARQNNYIGIYISDPVTAFGSYQFFVSPEDGLYYTKTNLSNLRSIFGVTEDSLSYQIINSGNSMNQFYVNDTDTFSQNGFSSSWDNYGALNLGTSYDATTRKFYFNSGVGDFVSTNQSASIYATAEEGIYLSTGCDEGSSQMVSNINGIFLTSSAPSDENTFNIEIDRTYTDKKIVTSEGFEGNYVQFNTSATETIEAGKIVWNQTDGTFDMGLLNNVTLQAGQEMHMYAKASGAIANGDAVQFAGAQGDHLLVKKAVPSEINANPEYFVGIATQTFANNQFGYVTVFGQVRDLNTSMYSGGTVLYYQSSGSTAGLLTNVRPTGPLAKITVAAVVRSHNNQGAIFVRPHVMPRIDALQDVVISAATGGDVLTYNSSTQVWENKTLNEITGEFNYILTTPVSFSGTAQETEVLRLEIPPYTFAANDMLKIPTLFVQKTGVINSYSIRVKISTSATMPATTTDMVALYNGAANASHVNMTRTFFLSGGVLRGIGTASIISDYNVSTTQLNVAFDHTETNYLYISIDSAGPQDTQTLVGFQLTNR
jgi:hypothetical protein